MAGKAAAKKGNPKGKTVMPKNKTHYNCPTGGKEAQRGKGR